MWQHWLANILMAWAYKLDDGSWGGTKHIPTFMDHNMTMTSHRQRDDASGRFIKTIQFYEDNNYESLIKSLEFLLKHGGTCEGFVGSVRL